MPYCGETDGRVLNLRLPYDVGSLSDKLVEISFPEEFVRFQCATDICINLTLKADHCELMYGLG